jgi:phage baseplate assembly protein W
VNIDFPFRFDDRGRTAVTDDADHIRDMIEQYLFTAAGERVNRPQLGSGLMHLVFEPNGEALASSVQRMAQAGLQQYLGDLIDVQLLVVAVDSTLRVDVRYVVRRTGEPRVATFEEVRP